MLYSIFPLVSIWTNVAYQKLKKMRKRLNESAPMEFNWSGCVIGDHSLIAIELHHPSQTCGTRFAGKLSDQYLTPTRTWTERYRREERAAAKSFKEAVVIASRQTTESVTGAAGDSADRWFSWISSVFLERSYRMSPRDQQRFSSNVPKNTTRAGQHEKWFGAW